MIDRRAESTTPISTCKALGLLVPIYLLITLPVVWRIRQICLIDRNECAYRDLVDTVASSKLLMATCVLIVGLLVFLTAHVVKRARNNTLGVEEDTNERRFNGNGYLVAVVITALYLGGSVALLMDAAEGLEPFDIDKADAYFWKSFWVMQGTLILGLLLWHFNDYFLRPVSRVFLAVLFFASLSFLFWMTRLSA